MPSLVSCVDTIEVDKDVEPVVCVNCVLSANESVQIAELKYSGKIGDMFYSPVTEADVTLYKGEEIIGSFTKKNSSQWKLDYIPEPESSYKLVVEIPGREAITAETAMPSKVPIKKAGAISDTRKNFRQTSDTHAFWAFILNKVNAYEYDVTLPEHISEREYSLENSIATNHPAVDNFNAKKNVIFENFGGHYVEHYSYLRMAESKTDNFIDFEIEGNQHNCIVVFRAASAEYDKYLKSSLLKVLAYASDDLASHLEENVIFSNINGGVGIFGAYNDLYILENSLIDGTL